MALREAIINAIAHREYHNAAGSIMIRIFDDRVHVISSGSLHFGLTPDQLYRPHRPLPWNPQIAQTLYRCGLVDTMGTGIIRMARISREQGLSIPVITDDGGAVTVAFTRPGHAPPALRQHNLKPRQLALVEAIAAGFTTRGAIARELDLTDRGSRRALEELQARSLAVFQGHGGSARWQLTGDALTAYPDLTTTPLDTEGA
ncbi:MAG: ATP-binding protein [Mycobacteriales bacterium]